MKIIIVFCDKARFLFYSLQILQNIRPFHCLLADEWNFILVLLHPHIIKNYYSKKDLHLMFEFSSFTSVACFYFFKSDFIHFFTIAMHLYSQNCS